MKKLFMFLLVALFAVGFVACTEDTTTEQTTAPVTQTTTMQETTTQGETTTAHVNVVPVLAGVADIELAIGDVFSPMLGITATDEEDGDLTASIMMQGTYDLNTAGDYTLTYTVNDANGGSATAQRVVSVSALELTNPTGFYDYKFATTELRHTFMAAAESYLMNNMAGGVPLFANGGFVLYSPRVALPVTTYVPVMGWGAGWGTFTADDSTVLMDDGEAGNVGEYTYRTTISTNPGTFNQWLYDTSTDSDLMGVYYDAPYEYQFNAAKDSYELVTSMASSFPVPVDATVTETGKEVANTWRISLRDDLLWFFNPDTDTTGFAAGFETIDANDFVDTFKLALDQEWFRAISGGGDFLNEATGIVNAQEYVDGDVEWAEVGIKLIDDLTFEFTFVNDMSEWNVKYFLSSFVMTPVSIELFNALDGDDDDATAYGLDENSVGYHGAYYVDYYEADKILRYKENTNYYDQDKFFFTGYTFSVIEDSAVRFQEYLAGKLEAVSVPTENYETYKDHPSLKLVPGATEFRIMINGLGTVADQTAEFPGSTWVPEPILANEDFKMAMFFAVDRQKLAEEVMKTSTTNMYLFSNAYVVDAEIGDIYRETAQGISVGAGLSPSTHGFNPSAATALYELAIEALVAAGTYTAGTVAVPTMIEIEFNYFSGSEAQVTMFEYLKTTFEALFMSTEYNINVQLTGVAKDFPDIYYDYMMVGEFDLSIGGISGSTLDAASFLDTYSSDNRGGFTLNWGIDTSVSEIPVLYRDFLGHQHYEMWSFDAISSVLNGRVYLIDGAEADIPAAVTTDIGATGFTFHIEEFSNPSYENLTYTIQVYEGDAYVNVVGMENIPATTADITVSGVLPHYYWYDATGAIVAKPGGDYQVVINFDYVADGSAGTSTGIWFYTNQLVAESVMSGWVTPTTVTPTDIEFTITVSPEFTEAIASVKLVSYGDWVEVTTATIDYTDLTAVTVTGLDTGSSYALEITFADGSWDLVRFSTADVITEAVVVATQTGATIAMTLNSDDSVVRTVTAAVVYAYSTVVDVDDAIAAGATVVYTDLTAVVVDVLTEGTDYYVEFTFSDGSVETVDVTTEAAPTV